MFVFLLYERQGDADKLLEVFGSVDAAQLYAYEYQGVDQGSWSCDPVTGNWQTLDGEYYVEQRLVVE